MGNITRNWQKENSGYTEAESLAELCPTVTWKAELLSDELGYLTEISKQSIEDEAWFLLLASSNK